MNKTYMIGESVKGGYEQIGHCETGILWWAFRGKFRKHISKATMRDFHCFMVREIDNVEADSVFRGRYFGGIATILPPVNIYSKPNIRLPKRILDMLYANLKPKLVLVSTPNGLYRILKNT